MSPRFVVDFNGTTGHLAVCSACGWESRPSKSPDLAYKAGLAHQCKEKK